MLKHPLARIFMIKNNMPRFKLLFPQQRVFPVASGGLHPKSVPKLVKRMGKDIIIQAGGGIHGHPGGTIAGAKAMRAAVERVI